MRISMSDPSSHDRWSRGSSPVSDDPRKRTRIQSPSRRSPQERQRKTAERIRKKKTRLEERFWARKEATERAFWENQGIPAYTQESFRQSKSNYGTSKAKEEEVESEIARQARIEESRRKLAELEKDRPLWEDSKRKREAREREEALRGSQEKRRREARAQQQRRYEEHKKRREDGPGAQYTTQEREMLKEQKSKEMFVSSSLGMAGWNFEDAHTWYIRTAEAFDKATFSNDPVMFAIFPWPILLPAFSIQDISWTNVEEFFITYSRHMSTPNFKRLVLSSQRRFHPDKWRARKVLHNVRDEVERDLLEAAGNLVSQAINPFWERVRNL
jgi:hypothetical protein